LLGLGRKPVVLEPHRAHIGQRRVQSGLVVPEQPGYDFVLAAMKKVLSRTLEDGSPVHSFQTLMAQLQTVVRNTCRTPKSGANAPTFQITTTPSDKQKRALELIGQIKM